MLSLLLSTENCLKHDRNDYLLVVFSKCCGEFSVLSTEYTFRCLYS